MSVTVSDMVRVALDDLVEDNELLDPVEARYQEWMQKRRGKITCSRFGDLMGEPRSSKSEWTDTALSYIRQVIAGRLGSTSSISAKSLEWGTDNEPHAVAEYSKRFGRFVSYDPWRFMAYSEDIGGSPDALIDDDGCMEVKCPWNPGEHIKTLINKEVPKEYVWQVDGHLLVSGRMWCDFVSFDPRIESDACRLAVVRVYRDEDRIAKLRAKCELAAVAVNTTLARLLKGE